MTTRWFKEKSLKTAASVKLQVAPVPTWLPSKTTAFHSTLTGIGQLLFFLPSFLPSPLSLLPPPLFLPPWQQSIIMQSQHGGCKSRTVHFSVVKNNSLVQSSPAFRGLENPGKISNPQMCKVTRRKLVEEIRNFFFPELWLIWTR